MLCWLGVVAGLLCSSHALTSPGYRLPDNLEPSHYNLEIITHLEDPDFYFEGKVWIKVRCLKPTNTIILHAHLLNITEDQVTVQEMVNEHEFNQLNIAKQSAIPANEFHVIKLEASMKPDRDYIVYMPFRGLLTEGLNGYYRSKYFDITTNSTKWLAVTQFEATDARRAFPCFDEPAMKAVFSIKLGHRENLKSVSNMPIIKTTPIEGMKGWIWDHYENTLPMSTYLVAFMVSEFEYKVSPIRDNNVTFRIWARHDAINQTEFAREIGPKLLEFFENYYDVKYPLPKQDMAAIPDFSAGAMENWGLITYREALLLFDKKSSSTIHQFSMASVIAHELAHQWFGNLVTMKWWTDLWLNEGFATYMAAIGVHHEFPEWNSLELTGLENIHFVFLFDALNSSHPVSVKINNYSEIGQIFDTISYKKGSALLRMMHMFLGESTLRKAVSNYLKDHRYSNAEQDDLWQALTKEGHKEGTLDPELTIKEVMDTWTLQTGYPILTVIRDYEKGTATITQERYLQILPQGPRSNELSSKHGPCWWVPVTYTTQVEMDFNNTKPQLWLNCGKNRSASLTSLPDENKWLLLNINGAGLYRVQYDEHNWKLLASVLNSPNYKTIGTVNRAHLLINAFDLAWRGDLNYSLAISLASYLKHEQEYIPWKTGLSSLNHVDRMLRRTSNYGAFKKYIKELLKPIYEKYNKMTNLPKSFEELKHHTLITNWACRFEIGDCQKQANELFSKWKLEENPDINNPIPSDIKGVVYCNAIRNGGEETWNFLWERYLKSNVGSDKGIILSALGCSRDVWILNRYLDWSLDSGSGLRKQDSATIFVSVLQKDVGYYVAKEFLYERILDIYKFHGLKSNRQSKYLSAFGEHIVNEAEKLEWAKFLETHKDLLKFTHLAAHQSIETATSNARWTSLFYEKLSKTLAL